MARRNAVVLFALLPLMAALTSFRGATAQDATTTASTSSLPTNSFTSPLDIREGGMVVRGRCSSCHGLDGTGGRAPDLTRKYLRHGNTDEAMFRNIQKGIPGTGMAGTNLPDRTVWRVVSYLQSGRKGDEPPVLTGDADAGQRLFVQHNCDSCHWTGKDGGRRGPNLGESRVTLDYMRRAILDPNADSSSKHQQLVLALADGRIVRGLLLNENGYHIQLIDQQENLHTIAHADIEALQRPLDSLMQSYSVVLTHDEIEDLIAYVYSLRETNIQAAPIDEARDDKRSK